MIKLNNSQRKWLTSIYNTAFRESADNNFSLRVAANLYAKTKLNPDYSSPLTGEVGIAGLNKETSGIDPANTGEAIAYVVKDSLDKYLQSEGDISTIDVEDSESISQIQSSIEEELFGNTTTFTGIDSLDNRFKRSLNSNNTEALKGVVGELINNRVSQRSKVLTDA